MPTIKILTQFIIASLLFLGWTGRVWSAPPVQNYVVLLLDASGSMKQSDPQFLRREATKLLITLLRQGDRILLAEFGEGVRALTDDAITLSPDTQETLFRLVDGLSSQDKYTDILGAFAYAASRVASLPAEARRSFVPTVILLTDGKDEMPGQGDRTALIDSKIQELAQLEVKVHTIGFPGKSDMKILERAANRTGGDLWVIYRAGDLLRGFFALSRVMGNRWPLTEQSVNQGAAEFLLPEWARRVTVCYLPSSATSERVKSAAPITQEITTTFYQILKYHHLPSHRLALTFPASGTILVDGEGALLIRAEKGRKAPARAPFPFRAAITPAKGEELGRPHFLSQTFVTLTLRHPGLSDITLPMYDGGQHEDGEPGDGRYGTFVPGLREGLWNYQVTARTVYAPTLSEEGQVEVVAQPVAVGPPGRFFRWIVAPFTGRLTWQLCNLTDFPVAGELWVTAAGGTESFRPVKWTARECQRVSVLLAADRHRGAAGKVAIRLSQQPEPLWAGEYSVRPWWEVGGICLGIFALMSLTFIFPRRSLQGSTITVTARIDGEDISRVLRIGRDGQVEPSDLPPPIDNPGKFRVRSGLWFRGLMYEPAQWCQPNFPGEKPPRKRQGFLLRKKTSWICRHHKGVVKYDVNPRL